MVAYRILKESASHTSDFNKAMAYSDNVRDIDLYFNDLYNLGIPKSVIVRNACLHRLLSTVKFGNKLFVKELFYSFSKAPQIVLKKYFWKIVIKRILNTINISM